MRGDLYRAVVTRTSTAGVWFTIGQRWPGVEFGPCPLLANVVRVGPLTTETASAHTHDVLVTEWLADLVAADDRVLVADTDREDFVVLGVLREGVSE